MTNDRINSAMTQAEALHILNDLHIPTRYADEGACPLCKRQSVTHDVHEAECPFAEASRVVSEEGE